MALNDYGVNFNGRRIVHPGAYDSIDASAMTAVTPGGLNLPVVVGKALAGKAGEIKYFSGTDTAREYLRGGDLMTALELMFSPTPEGGGGASRVGVVVANETTQAAVTAGGIEQKSVEYGDGGNRILAKLEAGTITGSKKYTVTRWDLDKAEVYDNVGAVIDLEYTGADAYAVVTVTVVDSKATKITVETGVDAAAATVDLEINLTTGQFATIDDVIAHISGVSGYTAKFVELASAGLDVTKLDAVADVNIKTGGYLKAVKADLEYRVNNNSELVSVEVGGAITDFDSTYLTGGSVGTTPSSWSAYFDTIKRQFSDILVVLTDDASIHAEALSHVGVMERRNQKQLLFVGGGVNESITAVKQRAAAMNSSRAVVAYPGIYHRAHQGGLVPLPAFFTAAMLAGRVAGLPASEPITFDYFSILGLEKELLAGDPEVDDLITSGVATLERVQNGGFRLVQGITSYLGGNNTLYREISVRRGADSLSERVRKTLEDRFVGKKGLRATSASVTTATIDILEQAIKDGDITSYRNIVVRVVGTVIYVDYQVAPAEPTNYILVTSHFVPETV
jgi:hypothetical protein